MSFENSFENPEHEAVRGIEGKKHETFPTGGRVTISDNQREYLKNKTLGNVRFNILGFVNVLEQQGKCPFCSETLKKHVEEDAGGQVANEMEWCDSCGFDQSPIDGRLILPKGFVEEYLEGKTSKEK